MLPPVAPSGVAQPMITSSTSAGSSLARSSACLTTWPPMVAPWVMLRAPRQDLHSGVRAVETITASVICVFSTIPKSCRCSTSPVELPAFTRETFKQWRWRPELTVRLVKPLHARIHLIQTDGVGIEHRAASVARETVTVEIDDIDVARAQGNTLVQNLRSLVDQRIHATLQNFLVADLTPFDAGILRGLDDERFDYGVGDRSAIAGLISVPARASFLPEAPQLADLIRHLGIAQIRRTRSGLSLADIPAHIESRQVAHREGSHCKTKI